MKARQLALQAAIQIANMGALRNNNSLTTGVSAQSVLTEAKKIEGYLIEDDNRKFTEDDMVTFSGMCLRHASQNGHCTPGNFIRDWKKEYWRPNETE